MLKCTSAMSDFLCNKFVCGSNHLRPISSTRAEYGQVLVPDILHGSRDMFQIPEKVIDRSHDERVVVHIGRVARREPFFAPTTSLSQETPYQNLLKSRTMPAVKQAPTRQAITLKGSTNLVTEFFKYAANTSVVQISRKDEMFTTFFHCLQHSIPAWSISCG